MLAFNCVHNTVKPYIGGDINLTIEANIHQQVNKDLELLNSSWSFSAQTIFDYDTEELVTTLNAKSAGGTTLDKPIKMRHTPRHQHDQRDYAY